MHMNIDISYKLGEAVKFNMFLASGRIEGIMIKKNALLYLVRYIFNGKVEEGYFYADELKRVKQN